MEDFYFENEFKNREKEKLIEYLDRNAVFRSKAKSISEDTKRIYQYFDDILYEYYARIIGYDERYYNSIKQKIENFKEQLTDEKIFEMYSNYKFSPEEMEYIKLVEISNTWRGYKDFDVRANYAITDILLRAKIIEEFGESSLEVFRDIITRSELFKSNQYRETVSHYMKLLSDKPYEEDIHIRLENEIEKQVEYYFNQAINCGGYALKIDQPVFPTYQENFSQSVSTILNKFPFVRLLGDTLLEDDEYLVIYKAPKGKNTGHHFIRVDDDATVREKDGNGEPRIFENWGNLEDSPEAIFAVKKEHKMFGYENEEVNKENNGLDFEESVTKAIKEKNNSFSYHNHEFFLKKSKEDEIFVTDIDGKIVAEVIVGENECLVEVHESEKSYVENTNGGIIPIIQNGKLINFEQFKRKNIGSVNFDER